MVNIFYEIVNYLINLFQSYKIRINPNIKISTSAHIQSNATINCEKSGHIEIGKNVLVNDFCVLYTYGSSIKIGNRTLIGPSTVIHTHHHNFQKTDLPIQLQKGVCKPIIIGDDVWIGAHCTILGGVTIGSHSVIGAHSLVTKDIPPYSVAYGVPCTVKRLRNDKN